MTTPAERLTEAITAELSALRLDRRDAAADLNRAEASAALADALTLASAWITRNLPPGLTREQLYRETLAAIADPEHRMTQHTADGLRRLARASLDAAGTLRTL